MLRATLAAMRGTDLATLEEAARACGASFRQRFLGIVLPNARRGILAGSLMVVALSLGEFNTTLLLATPFTMTLPVGLADSYASMRLEIGSAFTLLFLVLVVPPMVALQAVADRVAK
jgi:putative spermidine/putrescine transport system permease protein